MHAKPSALKKANQIKGFAVLSALCWWWLTASGAASLAENCQF
ncbi:MAG: hypothetical protein Q8K34_07750 [Hydrogenophaga sp.]|jgi:hypothetical protein|nr:hypothetical protein [Hydrogenophaga sp.]MDP2092486.1 hypothetical protein [Hydrogenophaga sp.]MDP2220080.1 hypothetical protein [Hydrogenophaga sp.]MDP3924620.1 hypothetical protein [Hydrogenophaga sp.]MDZ4124223.1 hypothetical protein [Hydrogenophaga sp.]